MGTHATTNLYPRSAQCGTSGFLSTRPGTTLHKVVFAIGLLGVIVAATFGAYTYSVGREYTGHTRSRATWASLRTIKNALVMYSDSNAGAYPASLSVLQQGPTPFVEPSALLRDAWKNPFIYVRSPAGGQHPFSLFSNGPDGQFETHDDLDVWKEPTE
jgi:hypothetical protein